MYTMYVFMCIYWHFAVLRHFVLLFIHFDEQLLLLSIYDYFYIFHRKIASFRIFLFLGVLNYKKKMIGLMRCTVRRSWRHKETASFSSPDLSSRAKPFLSLSFYRRWVLLRHHWKLWCFRPSTNAPIIICAL